jgi:hypothetical protein
MLITNTNEATVFHGQQCYINMIKDRNKGRENGPIKAIMVPFVITNSRPSNGGYSFEVRQYETIACSNCSDERKTWPHGGAAYFDSSSLWKAEDGRFVPLIDDKTDQGSIVVDHHGLNPDQDCPDAVRLAGETYIRIYPELLAPSELGPVVQDKDGRLSQSAVTVNNDKVIAKGKARKAAKGV